MWRVQFSFMRRFSDFAVSAISQNAAAKCKPAITKSCCFLKKGGSRLIQSQHDGDGELHVAFAIPTSELASWEAWLAENGIAVEEKRTWELGGQSLYFRDPYRHLIEIATPGVWSIY
jgi:catechol 2,3-dioxygenase-like lactoylglutathione lyase family enzyme